MTEAGRYRDASLVWGRVVASHPKCAEALCQLALGDVFQGQYRKANDLVVRALEAEPEYAPAHVLKGMVAYWTGDLRLAVSSCDYALELDQDLTQAHVFKGLALHRSGDHQAAIRAFNEGLERAPTSAELRTFLGITHLTLGDFEIGWAHYEWRLKSSWFASPSFPSPTWDGTNLKGRLIVHAEQGLGDTFQFVRYLKPLRDRVSDVIFACPPRLLPLLSESSELGTLHAADEPLPKAAAHVSLLSLPHRLGMASGARLSVPYLHANERLVSRWRPFVERRAGLRVGIAWQGNPGHLYDRFRSVRLDRFASIASVPGVQLFSLQQGVGTEQLRAYTDVWPIHELGPRCDRKGAFMDTAAVMQHLDLVITVDSAIAHLAGGLGVPVWVVLAADADFRWLLDRSVSPLYPSMRLFRQRKSGDWSETFNRVRLALAEYGEGAR